ncbi:MAG TPA: hypothetical protein VFA32_00550 [Dehalococcoidia bacterium]|nr:hypothetical protein [Dehalococcoidia bacterium]
MSNQKVSGEQPTWVQWQLPDVGLAASEAAAIADLNTPPPLMGVAGLLDL